jgi:hypothetical protein
MLLPSACCLGPGLGLGLGLEGGRDGLTLFRRLRALMPPFRRLRALLPPRASFCSWASFLKYYLKSVSTL